MGRTVFLAERVVGRECCVCLVGGGEGWRDETKTKGGWRSVNTFIKVPVTGK